MLHQDKVEFIKILERTSAQTGFTHRLLEKDYFITIILSYINDRLSSDLIFKGGTCLNKIYHAYYRLSEDLDFSHRFHNVEVTRKQRRKIMQPIKDTIKYFVESINMKIEDTDRVGFNESKQYIYNVLYESVVLNKMEKIKFEIGLRYNPILPVERHDVMHKFSHPFTGEPLFKGGNVICLSIKELIAEKLRAATTRRTIASRDFYDLWYLFKVGFDFKELQFLTLFKTKLAEDGFTTNLKKYRHNFGRTKEEIADMKLRIKDELFPVLTVKEKESFNIVKVLNSFNKVFKNIE
jgi:predicted nucleotidyltransferase component of viral defense system